MQRSCHLISDLHLEFYNLTKIPRLLEQIVPQSNICVLAGDIGYPFQNTYEAFLRGISLKFKHTFLIHGNHEYYQREKNKNKSMKEIIEKTTEITKDLPNVHFLNNTWFDLDDHRFIGSTLWSKVDPLSCHTINDVQWLTIGDINQMHKRDQQFIDDALRQAECDAKNVVMITHHVPSHQLTHPKYHQPTFLPYKQWFSSNSDCLIRDPVKLWLFGHTHAQLNMQINGVQCVSNPIGYPGENKVVSFNVCVEI